MSRVPQDPGSTADESVQEERPAQNRSGDSWWRRAFDGWSGLALRVVIGLTVLAVITHLLVKPFVIPSGSMEPTLQVGDRVAAQIVGVDGDQLERGAVIAFAHGETWEADRLDEPSAVRRLVRRGGDLLGFGPSSQTYTVKRVIGLPGEHVRCCDEEGRLLIDGEPLDEPYVGEQLPFVAGEEDCDTTPVSRRCFPELVVPEGRYLVLGDNRADSADSVIGCRGLTEPQPSCARYVRGEQVVGTVEWRWWPWPPGSAERT